MVNPFLAIWRCFRYDNREITAWLKVTSARGPTTIVVSLFTTTALLFIAGQLAVVGESNVEEVDIGIATVAVGSVVSISQVMETVLNLILMPLFGALADAKDNRKTLLVGTNVIWVAMMGASAALFFFEPSLTQLWILIILILIVAVFYELALFLAFAYLPEVVESESQLTKITSRQYAIVNTLQTVVAGILVGLGLFLPEDVKGEGELNLTVIAHVLVILIWLYYAVPGIIMLPSRTKKQENKNASSRTCSQLMTTISEIRGKYPQVGWFLLSWIFYFSGVISLTVLQTIFLTEEFSWSTSEVSFVGGVLIVFSIIGAGIFELLAKRFRLKTLLTFTILLWTFGAFSAPFLLFAEDVEFVDEETNEIGIRSEPTAFGEILAYAYGVVFGLAIGLIYPVNVSIYALIVPGGEEASYFGVKAFGSRVLAWAPPLVFTFINERVSNIQFAFASLGFWFLASLPFIFMLDVEKGIQDVQHTLHLRNGAGADIVIDGLEAENLALDKEVEDEMPQQVAAIQTDEIEDVKPVEVTENVEEKPSV